MRMDAPNMNIFNRLLLATTLGLLIAAPASAETGQVQRITKEAEDYIDSHNIAGSAITADANYLYGVDIPGEWTEYQITGITDFGTRTIFIKLWGALNVAYHLQVIVTPETMAVSDTVDVFFTGLGSCGA
jgi:hypothetical protein